MSARLVIYQHVPCGFEMVIDNPDIEMGKVWNLWFNVTLSDAPEAWDSEIKLINAMQSGLGELSADRRLIRAQMAEFCRVHPLFPRSIDILCEEIGTGCFSRPVSMGCEGRGLLNALAYHNFHSLSEQRRETLTGYVQSLNRWLAQDNPESLVESKVFGFLGQPTGAKEAFVQKLVSTIDPDVASISSLKKLSENMCRETQGESVFEGAGRPLNCFKCDACSEEGADPACRCCYGMLLDAALLCVGTFGEERSVFNEFTRFTQENVLAYSLAINSWLQGLPTESMTSLTARRYVTDDVASQLVSRVHTSLGEKDEAKEWLVACLLKTIKSNQRWHKRVELIDGFPQATSWFKEYRPAQVMVSGAGDRYFMTMRKVRWVAYPLLRPASRLRLHHVHSSPKS
jgi:hypothetical protein